MREASVEAVLFAGVKARGGWALKILPSVAGMPDRIVVLPGGRHYFVELKRVNTDTTALQQHRHEGLAAIGHPVAVLHGSREVREWLEEVCT